MARGYRQRTQRGFPIWFFVLLLEYAQTYVRPTGTVSTITRVWPLSMPLTGGIVVFAVLAWKVPYRNLGSRLRYTLVALEEMMERVETGPPG